MNIDQALIGVANLIIEIKYNDEEIIGAYAKHYSDELCYLYEYAKTMRATPTTHDSAAEFNSWDEFFAEIREGN